MICFGGFVYWIERVFGGNGEMSGGENGIGRTNAQDPRNERQPRSVEKAAGVTLPGSA